jgi:hypothetical protein
MDLARNLLNFFGSIIVASLDETVLMTIVARHAPG